MNRGSFTCAPPLVPNPLYRQNVELELDILPTFLPQLHYYELMPITFSFLSKDQQELFLYQLHLSLPIKKAFFKSHKKINLKKQKNLKKYKKYFLL